MIVAANRDEFHARAAAPAGFWDDLPVLAGRDLKARGTWMGVARNGRFAAVTNFRGAQEAGAPESRGALVTRFLAGTAPPGDFMGELAATAGRFSGFNLLAADERELWWLSNRGGEPRRLDPGIHGLGNTLLDAPEVDEAKSEFAGIVHAGPAVEPLFACLARRRIVGPLYGTRCATVLLAAGETLRYAERSFQADGAAGPTLQFELRKSR